MDVKQIFVDANTTFNRIIQQAEETFLDAPKTEYSEEYKNNIRKVEFLTKMTEKLICDTEEFLEPKYSYNLDERITESMTDSYEKLLQIEEFGFALRSSFPEIKDYSPLLYKDLLRVGKYELKLGKSMKDYRQKEAEKYFANLKHMLECDMVKFREQEIFIENLRLDHDYAKNKMEKAYSPQGRVALEKDYEKIKVVFDKHLDETYALFRTVDHYFVKHRIFLKEFVEIQRNYYRQCDKNLTSLLRKMYHDTNVNENDSSKEVETVLDGQLSVGLPRTDEEIKVEISTDTKMEPEINVDLSLTTEKMSVTTEDNFESLAPNLNLETDVFADTKVEVSLESSVLVESDTIQPSLGIILEQKEPELSLTFSNDSNLECDVQLTSMVPINADIPFESKDIHIEKRDENLDPNLSVKSNLDLDLEGELPAEGITNIEGSLACSLKAESDVQIDLDKNIKSDVSFDSSAPVEGDIVLPSLAIALEHKEQDISLTLSENSNMECDAEVPSMVSTTADASLKQKGINIDQENLDANISVKLDTNLDVSGDLNIKSETDIKDTPEMKADLNIPVDVQIMGETSIVDGGAGVASEVKANENLNLQIDTNLEVDRNVELNAEIDTLATNLVDKELDNLLPSLTVDASKSLDVNADGSLSVDASKSLDVNIDGSVTVEGGKSEDLKTLENTESSSLNISLDTSADVKSDDSFPSATNTGSLSLSTNVEAE